MLPKVDAIAKLERQVDQIQSIKEKSRYSPEFKKWLRDTEVALENIFGIETRHKKDFTGISYYPPSVYAVPEPQRQQRYLKGLEEAQYILKSMIEEINEFWTASVLSQTNDQSKPNTGRILTDMEKPRLFIGSSVEGKEIADMLHVGLEYDVEVTVWHQGVFGLSQGNLESIVKAARGGDYDFAALVLTPDDLVAKRGKNVNSPRDNVIFELGLFMGALGRDRTFIVYCRDDPPDLPSDLAGVTPATFARRQDGKLQSALGPVCTQIKTAIKTCGFMSHEIIKAPSQSSDIILKDGLYFKQDGDGPFCTACYDTNKGLIRLTALPSNFRRLGTWKCNSCKAVY